MQYCLQKKTGTENEDIKKELNKWLKKISDTPRVSEYAKSLSDSRKSQINQNLANIHRERLLQQIA